MKKVFKKRSSKQVEVPSRITNETVSEHRERILAGGRRFKYPIQYARHKLVINAIILSVVALIVLIVFSWWQLYYAQTSNTFFYRVTKVLPLPVASVDGEMVRYSDYLMRYRPQEHFERSKTGQVDLDSKGGQRLLDSYRREALNHVEADAYAAALAEELDISVKEVEVDQVVNQSRKTAHGSISQENYDAALLDKLGYTPEEYRTTIRQSLLRQKVSYAIDERAMEHKDAVARQIEADGKKADFVAIAKKVNAKFGEDSVTVGGSGMVRKNNQDGGLTDAALDLDIGEISPVIKSTTGDGYYFVQLVKEAPTQLAYEYIKIPLTEFTARMQKLREDGKIKEYIEIPTFETEQLKQ